MTRLPLASASSWATKGSNTMSSSRRWGRWAMTQLWLWCVGSAPHCSQSPQGGSSQPAAKARTATTAARARRRGIQERYHAGAERLAIGDDGGAERVVRRRVSAAVVVAGGLEDAVGGIARRRAAAVDVGADAVAHLDAAAARAQVDGPRLDVGAWAPAGARVLPGDRLVVDGVGGAVVAPHRLGLRLLAVDGDGMGQLAELGAVVLVALAVATHEQAHRGAGRAGGQRHVGRRRAGAIGIADVDVAPAERQH